MKAREVVMITALKNFLRAQSRKRKRFEENILSERKTRSGKNRGKDIGRKDRIRVGSTKPFINEFM